MAPRRPALRSQAVKGKRGFTLLEVLLVVALTAISAALLLPRLTVMTDQAAAQGEFLKFQQQVLDLRRQAFHETQGLRLVSSGEFPGDEDADTPSDPPLAEAQLSPGWTYRLSAPVDIDSGGRCSAADVDILHGARVALHLQGQGPSCRFLRPVG